MVSKEEAGARKRPIPPCLPSFAKQKKKKTQVWCCLCAAVGPQPAQGLDKPYKVFLDGDGGYKIVGKDVCHQITSDVHTLPVASPETNSGHKLPDRCWKELWACPSCVQANGRNSFGSSHSGRDRYPGSTLQTEHRRLSDSPVGAPAENTRGQADALRAVVLQQDAEIVDAVCQLSSAESKATSLEAELQEYKRRLKALSRKVTHRHDNLAKLNKIVSEVWPQYKGTTYQNLEKVVKRAKKLEKVSDLDKKVGLMHFAERMTEKYGVSFTRSVDKKLHQLHTQAGQMKDLQEDCKRLKQQNRQLTEDRENARAWNQGFHMRGTRMLREAAAGKDSLQAELETLKEAMKTSIEELANEIAEKDGELELLLQEASDENFDPNSEPPNDEAEELGPGSQQPGPSQGEKSVPVKSFMRNKRHYAWDRMMQLQHLVNKFGLRTSTFCDLVTGVVALVSDKPAAEVKEMIDLPSQSTLVEHGHLYTMALEKHLSENVQAAIENGFYGVEVDEGQWMKKRLLALLVTVLDKEARLGRRYQTGARPIPACSGKEEAQGIFTALKHFEWDIIKFLWLVSDSASSMESARLIVETAKQKRMFELCGKEVLANPSFLPPQYRPFFYVLVHRDSSGSTLEDRELLPIHVYRAPDMAHCGKNSEAAGIAALGGGVTISNGDYKSSLFKTAMFRLARLFQGNNDMQQHVDDECTTISLNTAGFTVHFKAMPGVIKHRLKIMTKLSIAYTEPRQALLNTFKKVNRADGQGKWVSPTGKPIVEHIREVFYEMHDPRVVFPAMVVAKLHPLALFIYAVFQEEGGFVMYRIASDIDIILDELKDMEESFDAVFSDVISETAPMFDENDENYRYFLQELSDKDNKWRNLTTEEKARQAGAKAVEKSLAKAGSGKELAIIYPDGSVGVREECEDDEDTPMAPAFDDDVGEDMLRPSIDHAFQAFANLGRAAEETDEEEAQDADSDDAADDRGEEDAELPADGVTKDMAGQRHTDEVGTDSTRGQDPELRDRACAIWRKARLCLVRVAAVFRRVWLHVKVRSLGDDIDFFRPPPELSRDRRSPSTTTVREVKDVPGPLHYSFGEGRQLQQECIARCKALLREYRRYATEHAAWYRTWFPSRLASYWDPKRGISNLQRDMHLFGAAREGYENYACPPNCKYCPSKTFSGIPKWSKGDFLISHAWALGFFIHPDHQDELNAAVKRTGTILLFPDASSEDKVRIPRGGSSLGPVLDMWYDTHFSMLSGNSMETERVLSKIRAGTARQASNTSTSKNTRSLMKHNNVNLGEISATEADAKELRAKRKVHVAAIRSLKAQGLTPDLEGIRDHLSERLAQALAKEAREAEEQEAAERRAHEEHEKKEKRDIRAAKKRYLEALQVTDQVLWVAEQLMRQLSIQADTSLGRAKSKLMAWILNQEAVTVAEVKELCFNVPSADTFEKRKVVTASLTKLPQVKARELWHAWVGDGLGSELALKDLRDLLKEMSKDMDVDEVENSLSKLP